MRNVCSKLSLTLFLAHHSLEFIHVLCLCLFLPRLLFPMATKPKKFRSLCASHVVCGARKKVEKNMYVHQRTHRPAYDTQCGRIVQVL